MKGIDGDGFFCNNNGNQQETNLCHDVCDKIDVNQMDHIKSVYTTPFAYLKKKK